MHGQLIWQLNKIIKYLDFFIFPLCTPSQLVWFLIVPRWLTQRKIFSQKCPAEFASYLIDQKWVTHIKVKMNGIEQIIIYIFGLRRIHLPCVYCHMIIWKNSGVLNMASLPTKSICQGYHQHVLQSVYVLLSEKYSKHNHTVKRKK